MEKYGWVVADATPPEEASNIQSKSVDLEEFDENRFEDSISMEPEEIQEEKQNQVKQRKPSVANEELDGKVYICGAVLLLLLLLLGYFRKFMRKKEVLKQLKKEREGRFYMPEFISRFEELCKAHGVKREKSRSVKEMLLKLPAEVCRDNLSEMLNYYYDVKFAAAERDEGREKVWSDYLQGMLAERQNALAVLKQ